MELSGNELNIIKQSLTSYSMEYYDLITKTRKEDIYNKDDVLDRLNRKIVEIERLRRKLEEETKCKN